MNKKIQFYLIFGIATVGVILILLSTYVFEFILPDLWTGIAMTLGFILVIISLIMMK